MAELRRLVGLLRPFWRGALLALLLAVLTILSSIALMMTSAWLISTAALQLGIASLGVAPTAVRFFGLSRALFRYLERLSSHDVTFRLLARLRVWFYARIEPLSLAQRYSFRSGDLISRIVSDIEELQDLYLRLVSPPLVAVITIAVVGITFSFFDIWAALTLVGFLLVTATLLPLWTWWSGAGAGRAVVDARTEVNTHLVDMIQGLADALAFGYAAHLQGQLGQTTDDLARWERSLARLDGVQSAFSTLMVNLAAVTVLWVAIDRVDGVLLATLTLGAIAAFEAVTPLAPAGQKLGRQLTAARNVFAVLDSTPAIEEPALPSTPAPDRPALKLDRVTFRYEESEPPILADFSLEVAYGQHVLVTGESGAGKSSLINILLRFAEYEAGTIEVGGVDLRRLPHEEVRRTFGVMTQRVHLFNTTLRENIRIGRRSAGDGAVEAAAQAAQIHEFIATLPNGYDTYVGEGGALLSGGERQRVALARVLLKDAPIWLLDEMTANLDPITAVDVLRTVFTVAKDRTILLATHQPDAVAAYPFDAEIRIQR